MRDKSRRVYVRDKLSHDLASSSVAHSFIRFHENGGTNTTVIDAGNGLLVANGSTITINNGVAGSWATAGMLTPATSNLSAQFKASDVCAKFNLNTRSFVCAFDLYVTTFPTGTELLFDIGGLDDNVGGGIAVALVNSGANKAQLNLKYRPAGGATVDLFSYNLTDAGKADGNRHSFVVFVDYVNALMSMYCDGVLVSSPAFPSGNRPYCRTNYGVTLLARGVTSGFPTQQWLGSGGSGAKVANMYIGTTTGDVAGGIVQFVRDHYYYPGWRPVL